MVRLDFTELLLLPIFFALILLAGKLLETRLTHAQNRRIYWQGLLIKQVGALFFALVYLFYYGGGDTTVYHHDAKIIQEAFWSNPITGIKILLYNVGDRWDADTYAYLRNMWMDNRTSNWTTAKITGFVEIFTLGTFLPASLLFGFFSFLGIWKLYQFFLQFYPQYPKWLGYSMLFIPSCVFWSSGIIKETLTSAAVGFFVYYFCELFCHKRRILFSVFVLLLSTWILRDIKSVTLLALLPGLLIWLLFKYQDRLFPSNSLKGLLVISSLLIFVGGMVLAGRDISNQLESQEEFAALQYQLKATHYDHGGRTKGHGGGEASSYQLDCANDLSFLGMVYCIPSAINVTLFRPYPWEVNKAFTRLMSLEGVALMFFTLLALFKSNVNSIKSLTTNPEILMALSYTIIFGFIVGLFSFNFGVLTRFKAPMMPFYVAMLVLIYQRAESRRN
ncbi:hypothetical protein [Algivirga pacifica]|uniref:Glycosyltransferase RgtA/B/C/D-like domain-containing protein n=1 Tax=Algivirga pacifica TaxID=1162670 RepID=A0ABP9DJR4_9BACT